MSADDHPPCKRRFRSRGCLGDGRFNVISIGFNQPADSPQALKSFAAETVSPRQLGISQPARRHRARFGARLRLRLRRHRGGFRHLLQVSVVDAEGRIYRQIYGEDYSADYLTEPLKQLVTGTPFQRYQPLSDPRAGANTVLVYDPRTGKYRVSYGLVLSSPVRDLPALDHLVLPERMVESQTPGEAH